MIGCESFPMLSVEDLNLLFHETSLLRKSHFFTRNTHPDLQEGTHA